MPTPPLAARLAAGALLFVLGPSLAARGGPADPAAGRVATVTVSTGLVGLAPGQTARLTLIDTSEGTRRVSRVRLRLLDEAGTVLAEAEAALRPGESAFVELPRSAPGERLSIRGVVRLVRPAGERRPSRDHVATLELVDTDSGRTGALVSCPFGPVPSGASGGSIGPYDCPPPCAVRFAIEPN